VRRRRCAGGAIAPSLALVCAFAGGPSLAAPAMSPEPSGAAAPSSLTLMGMDSAAPSPFARPRVTAVRIDTAEAPTIDADLSDPAWAKAAVIDNFTQRSPNPYEPATERTVVRILYD
jgi:hypothetical protein